MFKIVNNLDGLRFDDFFVRAMGITRGHKFKFFKKSCRLNLAKYGFGNRVCDDWNMLPDCAVNAVSVNCFKRQLDKYLRDDRGLI